MGLAGPRPSELITGVVEYWHEKHSMTPSVTDSDHFVEDGFQFAFELGGLEDLHLAVVLALVVQRRGLLGHILDDQHAVPAGADFRLGKTGPVRLVLGR